MTENAEKGWFKPSKDKDETVSFSADEPMAEDVVSPEVEAPVVEAPVYAPVSKEAEAAQMLQDAIARERAKIAERKKPFDDTSDVNIALVRRNEELQNKIDLLYTTGMWGDYTSYECKECPFSTLDAKLIRDHVKQHM